MKHIIHWIIFMLNNIFYDILIMIIGIFSKDMRSQYIKRYYPKILKERK